MNPLHRIADFAETQIGTQERPQHDNRGAAILKYQQATSLGGQGWPLRAGSGTAAQSPSAQTLSKPGTCRWLSDRIRPRSSSGRPNRATTG